jgi:hypothetical protein
MGDGQGRRVGLAVVCALVVAACGSSGPATTAVREPATPVGSLTTTFGAAVLAAPAGATALTGVAAHDGALVAAGADDDGAAIWTRDDGDGWRRDEIRTARRVPRIDAVAVHGGRGVAFGGDGGPTSHVWVGDGGSTWRPVPGDATGIDGRVNAVTADGAGWIAGGDAVAPEGGESYQGVVWSSRDGRTYRPLATGLDLAEGTVTDVAVGDGTVVVVGFDVTGGRVWTSDGGAFSPAAGTFGAMTMHGVTHTSDGFVIVGRGVGDLAPRAWRSVDGREWELLDIDDTGVTSSDELHDATTVENTVVVVGGSPTGGVVWTLDERALVRVGP